MENIFELLNKYIRAELIVLVPVLYIVNSVLVRSKISNLAIPYIIGAISIILSGLYIFSSNHIYNLSDYLMALFTTLTQGVLFAGATLYSELTIKIIPKKCKGKNCDIDKNKS